MVFIFFRYGERQFKTINVRWAMLESKGVSVNTVNLFVKTKFDSGFDKWISSLPPKSRDIHNKRIIPGLWYPSYDAIVVPTEKII